MWDAVLDAVLDTLKLFPFLLLLYILIELMEHNTKVGRANAALSGRWAPLLGGATGLVPMCGFSVMAAKLYEKRYVTLGTLLAVFIATSDEAFLVMLVSDMSWANMAASILHVRDQAPARRGDRICRRLLLQTQGRAARTHACSADCRGGACLRCGADALRSGP